MVRTSENRNFSTHPPPNSSSMSLVVVCCYYVGGSSPFHLVLQVQLIKLCKSLAKWGGWKLSNRFSPLSYPFITDEHGGLSPLILCSLGFRALTGFLVLATIIIVVFLTVLGERMAPPVWIISFNSFPLTLWVKAACFVLAIEVLLHARVLTLICACRIFKANFSHYKFSNANLRHF